MLKNGEAARISVLTPTHNRCDKIGRLYQSLVNQTLKEPFEWIILDDGSTDKTAEVVDSFQAEGKLSIRYLYQENRGKHIAFNKLIELVSTEYAVIMDDDGELLPDALERFLRLWDTCGKDNSLWCMCCRCIDAASREMVGSPLPEGINTLPWKKRREVSHKIGEERCGCAKTAYLRMYRYPDVDGLKFIPEGYLWSRLDAVAEQYYFNDIVRIYHQNEGESLSNRTKTVARYESDYIMYRLILNDAYMRPQYLSRSYLIHVYMYILACVRTGKPKTDMYRGMKLMDRIVIGLAQYPSGLLRKRRGE